MKRRAAFLDRDGTLIEDAHYLSDPSNVVLLDGAPEALRMLARAGYAIVIVTNQSGIARGLFTEAEYHAVATALETLLDQHGVHVDMSLFCPHHPDFSGPCDCRKPGLGMYAAAAAELGVDLARSIYVGDRVSDVQPALQTGGRGFLVRTGYGTSEAAIAPAGVVVVADVLAAARSAPDVDTPGERR
jgi:D-glycero-D-manno-heptose 1,7-bisphosphate phosphatase